MRKEARISTAVWRNPSFTTLPLACQGLYWMLLSQPDVSMCGVLPYLPSRWSAMCGSEDIDRALSLLEDAGTIVVDRGTSEVLIRTFVNHDGVLRGPKTKAGMWKAWAGVLSNRLRAVVLEQVSEHVDEAVKQGWITRSDADAPPYKPPPDDLSDTPSNSPSEPAGKGVSDSPSPRARAADLPPPTTSTSTDLGAKPPSNAKLFEALAQVCGIDWQAKLTKSERGEVNNAAKQLADIDATPEQVHAKAKAYRQRWPQVDVTPSALVKHWSKLESKRASAEESAAVRPYDPDDAEARFAALTGGLDDRRTA